MTAVLEPAARRANEARVLGVSFVSQMLVTGVTTYCFGYFMTPIAEEFATSRTAVAAGQSIFMAVSAGLMPLAGRVIDGRAVRGLICAGALVMGAAVAAISQVTALWQAGLLAGLLAFGSSFCGSLAGAALVVRAFPQGRERALGLTSVGTSAGGFALPLLAVPLIDEAGWRVALLVLGAGSGLLLAATAWFGIPPAADQPLVRDPAQRGAEHSARAVLRSRNFWPITLAMMLIYGSNTAILANLPALAGDVGVPAAQRASLVPALALSSLAGKLVYSLLGDRFDPRAPIWLASAVLVPALLALVVVPRFEVMLAVSIANGLGTGALLPAWAALVARCFGGAHFAGVMGLSRLCAYPLISTGGMIAAFSKDATGSYDPGFQGFLVGGLAVALLPFLMRVPQRV